MGFGDSTGSPQFKKPSEVLEIIEMQKLRAEIDTIKRTIDYLTVAIDEREEKIAKLSAKEYRKRTGGK